MASRLKSLELQGYKTFASRTVFEFAELITCIVGPNGSGKSNIADSIRWVLGEQTYSLLRAKKTEDMIFSGSDQRPRAGMASATITFDNSGSWLPIDFSEVAITRRAYRDGTNEYLLNGQRVRLKDVSELLAQSGLAERTYTIIGQGLVDAALALKAEDRRRLFEEAAGIGLHRDRKEEALRRLDTTQRNLERVQDILIELEPRLRSLERQARRAVEYEQVRADLKALLRDWYGYHWHQAQHDLTEALEAVHQREAHLEVARLSLNDLEESHASQQGKLLELRTALNNWHRQLAQLHTQREEFSRSSAILDERIRFNQQQKLASQEQIGRLEEEIGLVEARLRSVMEENSRLDQEFIDAREQIQAVRQELSNRQEEVSTVEAGLHSARLEQSDRTSRRERLAVRLSELQRQYERNQHLLDETSSNSEVTGREFQNASEKLESARQAKKEREEQRKLAELQLSEARTQLSHLETERERVYSLRNELNNEMASRKTQFDVLVQAENNLSGYNAGTRLLIGAKRDAGLSGVIGTLNDQIDVPAEYEAAITAALGEFLDAILINEDPEEALDLLVAQSTRGALLPVNWFDGQAGESVPAVDGILGLAADLVKVTPAYQNIIALLLGRVLVVRDRTAARRVLGTIAEWQGGSFSSKVVTLAGEVFYSGGPVLAGLSVEGGAQTILSRPRVKRDIQKGIQVLSQKLEGLDSRLAEADQEHTRLKELESGRLSSLQEAHRLEEQAGLDLNRAEVAVGQVLQKQNWEKEQQSDLEEASRGIFEQIQQYQEECRMLDEEIDQANQKISELTGALDGLAPNELNEQVAYWSMQSGFAEQALKSSRARLDDLTASISRTKTTYDNLLAQQQAFDLTQIEMEARKSENLLSEASVSQEIEGLNQVILPAEKELEFLEKQQSDLQARQAISRQTMSAADQQYTQMRISLARRQEALESLRLRIEDDFGLVAFEYEEEITGPTPLPLDGMVEQLPTLTLIPADMEENIQRQRAQLRRMGLINTEAQTEYQEVKSRYQFLTEQVADLEKAAIDIREVIHELDLLMHAEFKQTFEAVDREFRQIFTRLFGGGSARLLLTNEEDLTTTGIDIEARLPGRRTQGLSLLSGGERSLTAAALVFALLKVSPTPFCVLDEVDAMLDEANVARFRELLRELSQDTQFVVVTHNRNTVQAAQVIYGVTMGRDSTSQVLSLKLDEVAGVFE